MWLTLFILSCLVNLFFVFYIRWLLRVIASINEDMDSVSLLIRDFSTHLKGVHELEMFYGDETLGALLRHSKELSDRIESMDLLLQEEKTEEDTEPEDD